MILSQRPWPGYRDVIPMPRAFTSGARDLAWSALEPTVLATPRQIPFGALRLLRAGSHSAELRRVSE